MSFDTSKISEDNFQLSFSSLQLKKDNWKVFSNATKKYFATFCNDLWRQMRWAKYFLSSVFNHISHLSTKSINFSIAKIHSFAKIKGIHSYECINSWPQPLLASFEVQLIKLNWLYDLVDTNLVESKGQLISEWMSFWCLKFSKKPTKILTNFCPRI